MEFSYHPPPPTIATAVKAVWCARGQKHEFEQSDPIVPDGCVEMVFNLAAPFREGNDLQPQDLLVGQMTRPTRAVPTGEVDLVGVRFWPGRAGAVLRAPMWALQDQMAHASDLLGGADRWADEIRGLPARDRVRVLAAKLARFCARVDADRIRVVEGALSRITELGGNVSIDHLARRAGVSRRHLERQFRDQVGLSPKQVARIARVHAALQLIDTEATAGGAEVALRCGFSDQAHLIKECRAIAGITPTRLLSNGRTWSSLMRDSGSHGVNGA